MDESPNPAAKRRQRDDPAVRRAQILEEAIRIIGERGYYGFAVQELAQRCELTNGGLLYHFRSKEELLLAVLGEYERRIEAGLAPLIGSFNGTLSKSDSLILLRAILERSAAEPELERLFLVLQAEALNDSHPACAYFCKLEARMLEGFGLILEAHCADPRSTARQVYALMIGLEHQWLRAAYGFDLLAEWDRVIAKILPEGDIQ